VAIRTRVLPSAFRHGVGPEEIERALGNAIAVHETDDDLVMVIGPTPVGVLLEIGVVGSDPLLVVHAMPARPRFLR
jgi:hypothetical protein